MQWCSRRSVISLYIIFNFNLLLRKCDVVFGKQLSICPSSIMSPMAILILCYIQHVQTPEIIDLTKEATSQTTKFDKFDKKKLPLPS